MSFDVDSYCNFLEIMFTNNLFPFILELEKMCEKEDRGESVLLANPFVR